MLLMKLNDANLRVSSILKIVLSSNFFEVLISYYKFPLPYLASP